MQVLYLPFMFYVNLSYRSSYLQFIRNFKLLKHYSHVQNVSLWQISRWSAKPLLRYGDLSVFKMATVHHLGFLNWNFLQFILLRYPICLIVSNFILISETVAEIWIFFDLQDGSRLYLHNQVVNNCVKHQAVTLSPLFTFFTDHFSINRDTALMCLDMNFQTKWPLACIFRLLGHLHFV